MKKFAFTILQQSKFKIRMTYFFASCFLLVSSSFATDYEGMLINQNAKMSLCGELNYKRVQRDCADPSVSDIKRCLNLNKLDPIFKYQDKKQYSCVNSGFSHGVGIITEVLENSEKIGSCLAKNVFQFYNDVVNDPEFQQLSIQWEDGLDTPLNLDIGIDTKDRIFNLQVDLSNIKLAENKEDTIPLSVRSFKEQGPCSKFSKSNKEELFAKISNELSRLTLIKSKVDIDYINEESETNHGPQIYNTDRFE